MLGPASRATLLLLMLTCNTPCLPHTSLLLCAFAAQVVKETQSFQRVAVSRDEALAMFQENKFKVEIISNLPESATISLYRCAPPHHQAHS